MSTFNNTNGILISEGAFTSVRSDQVHHYHHSGEVEGRKGQQFMDI